MADRAGDGGGVFRVNLRNPTTDTEKAGQWVRRAVRRRLVPKFGVPATLNALINVAANLAMETGNDAGFKEVMQAFLDQYDSLKARNEVFRAGGGRA